MKSKFRDFWCLLNLKEYLKIEKTYQHQINCNNTTKHFSKQNNQTINEITKLNIHNQTISMKIERKKLLSTQSPF